jgi:hypothetical protein
MLFRFQVHRLVSRREWGLACDDEGMAIGPLELVVRSDNAGAKYKAAEPSTLKAIAAAIYGAHSSEHYQWLLTRVGAIAEAMSKGRHALACISAVQLQLGTLSSEIEVRLAKVDTRLRKFNPRWTDEPRDRHGRWTNEGANPIVPVIEPYTPECLAAIESAKRICIGHYTAMGGGLGFDWLRRCIRSHVPIECGY